MHILAKSGIGLLGLALVAAAGMADARADARSNIVVIGMTAEPPTLDPATGFTGFDYPYLYSLFDRLVDFEPKTLELRPGIAREWSFIGADRKILELKLRDGVKFHDGTDCDAEAVKASLEYFNSAGRRNDLEAVSDIVVKDRLTVHLVLKQEYSVLPAILSDRAGMIVSPTAVKKLGKDFARNPVGTGPFKLASWTPGSALDLVPFDQYWNKSAIKSGGIRFRIINSSTALVSAIMAGQVDHAFNLDPKNLPVLKANPKLRVENEPTLFYYQLMLNLATAPLDNPLVRQAVNMSIDRAALAKSVLGEGIGEGPGLMPVPPSSWAYSQGVAGSVKYDPVKAKELLAKAGYPDGITLKTCGTQTLGYGPDIMDIEREQMKAAGIRLEATILAGSACQQSWQSKTDFLVRQGGFTGRPDPFQTYQNNFHSKGQNNRGNVKFPGVDEALDKMLLTYTREGQKQLYDEVNRLWQEFVPSVVLFYGSNIAAYSVDLAGDQPNQQGKANPTTLYFKSAVKN